MSADTAVLRCPEPTNDRQRLLDLLTADYGACAPKLTPIFETPAKAIYRVDHAGGAPRVLRYYPATRPLERLREQAAIMRYVTSHGVPAEQVIPTTDGADMVVLAERGVLVTTFLEGAFPQRTPAVLRRLGESIGRLHALPAAPDEPALRRRASALPREDLAFGRACLDRIAIRLPANLEARYEALRTTLEATGDGEDLPAVAYGLMHNDCHLANAIQALDGSVAWFDWDGAGRGPRVAALGLLLYSSAIQTPDEHRPSSTPGEPPHLAHIAERVAAVLSGYQRHHQLSAAEVEYLPHAVRVRPAVIAARTFRDAVEQGVPPDATGWWARYAEADTVAACARRLLEPGSGVRRRAMGA